MSKMHLIKKEEPDKEIARITDENKRDAINIDDKIAVPKNLNLSDQSFGLFRKYLCMNAQNNFGKTNEEESEAIRRKAPSGPLVPLNSSDSFRPPSRLERVLFPGIKYVSFNYYFFFPKFSFLALIFFMIMSLDK